MNKMTTQQMETHPEAKAGIYNTGMIWQIILNYLDAKFPGAAAFLEQVAVVLPFAKVWQAIQTALSEAAAGKDFLTILKDVLAQWLVTMPNGELKMPLAVKP